MYVVVEENSRANSESFAGIKLYRPRYSSELKLRLESEHHLRSEYDAATFITYYPTISQYFIEDYPCVSITNLILDYREKGKWSYSKGIFDLA